MKKCVIGIIGRIRSDEQKEVYIQDDYRKAIIENGGIPLLILPSSAKQTCEMVPFSPFLANDESERLVPILDFCDGFLFPGGTKWFAFEQFIFEYALFHDKPVLGICLGMQMMANYDSFKTDCSDQTVPISSIINHQSKDTYVHDVFLEESKLKEILKTKQLMVNSRHSCQIVKKDFFHVSAHSIDGVIEAIEYPQYRFIIGVQWHPESIMNTIFSKRLFEAFVDSCQKKKSE